MKTADCKKSLKIAVQFFGHLRTFRECAPSIKKYLLDQYDCDVFMHTWSVTEHSTVTWHNDKCDISNVDDKLIEELKSMYNLKSIVVEEQKIDSSVQEYIFCEHDKGKSKISINGLMCMYYSKKRANDLRREFQREYGVIYDYVMMIRPDVKLYRKFELDNCIKELDCLELRDGRYCATNVNGGTSFPIIGSTASDILYFAEPSVADKIMEAISNISFETLNRKKVWNPETFLVKKLQDSGIESYYINYSYKESWEIIRASRKKFKSYINIRIRRRRVLISLAEFLTLNILYTKLKILEKFEIILSLGRNIY